MRRRRSRGAGAGSHVTRRVSGEPSNTPPATAPINNAQLHIRRVTDRPAHPLLVLYKRAANAVVGPHPARTLIGVTREDAAWWHVSLFDHVVVTDASQSGVRIRQRDKARATTLLLRAVRTLRKLRKELANVCSVQYRAAAPELTTRENWARLYGKYPQRNLPFVSDRDVTGRNLPSAWVQLRNVTSPGSSASWRAFSVQWTTGVRRSVRVRPSLRRWNQVRRPFRVRAG